MYSLEDEPQALHCTLVLPSTASDIAYTLSVAYKFIN